MTSDESRSVKSCLSVKISNKFLTNATILCSIPIKHVLQTRTHTLHGKKDSKSFTTTVSSTMST